MKRIVVLGSLNIDLVQRVPRLPIPGETLQGADLRTFVGGKGANQACAAALLGGRVQMGGKVGSDVFAERLIRELETAGVDTTPIQRSAHPSGSAIIFVLPTGENMIVISPGANADIATDFALEAVEHLSAGDLLLCQLETPLDAVVATLASAQRRGVLTILDPAPATELSSDLLRSVRILTPNQIELQILAGLPTVPNHLAMAAAGARTLQSRGAETVIVKMGAQGCLIVEREKTTAVSGHPVEVRDTTAAGDTFNGALAAALSQDKTLFESAIMANAAAALSVTKPGAIASIPTLSEVQELLSSRAAVR